MPGSPLASGDESPPDMLPTDDLAPPTPDQSPASGPLQQQAQQQLWAGNGVVPSRVSNDAALEEAIWHRQAAEAEHRHRVAVRPTRFLCTRRPLCVPAQHFCVEEPCWLGCNHGTDGEARSHAAGLLTGRFIFRHVQSVTWSLQYRPQGEGNAAFGMTMPGCDALQEAQAAADRARAAAHRLALERKAEEEQQAAVAAAAAGQLEAAAAAERTAAAAHAAAQQAAAEAGSSGVNLAHLHGVSLLQQDPGSPVRRPTPPPQRITFSEIEPADDAPRVHMAVDSPQRLPPPDAQRKQEAAAGHAQGASPPHLLPPPQPLHHSQQHVRCHCT